MTNPHAANLLGRSTVIDGDRIHIEGAQKNVRLFGADAPESGRICAAGACQRFLCDVRAVEEKATVIGRNDPCLV